MIDDLRRTCIQDQKSSLAWVISRATAYEISGVMAFLSYLEKKCKLAEFFADAGSVASGEVDKAASAGAQWLEGEYQADDGVKTRVGFLMLSRSAWQLLETPEISFSESELTTFSTDSVIVEYEALKDGSFKQTLFFGKTDSWEANRSELSESDIKQKVERACLYAWLVAYFESNPASATITVKPGRRARVKKGKEVKRALAEIRTIVIDGVEKIFTTDGINFRVHARGWHVRRHNVREHERHYASGKVAIVRAFQRGDINLGFVSRESQAAQSETRFSVQPNKVFFDTDQKAKGKAAAGK